MAIATMTSGVLWAISGHQQKIALELLSDYAVKAKKASSNPTDLVLSKQALDALQKAGDALTSFTTNLNFWAGLAAMLGGILAFCLAMTKK